MSLVCKYGIGTSTVVKPYRDVLQRWRKCLASLLFFAIVIMDNVAASAIVGLSHVFTPQFRNPWIPFPLTYQFSHVCKSQFQVPSVAMTSCAHDWKTYLRRFVPLHQCLHINDELVNSLMCGGWKNDNLHSIHLRFCAHYSLAHVFHGNITDETCGDLKKLQEMDHAAYVMLCQFESLLARYDCQSMYSVQWDCVQCKKAYKEWICSMLIPLQNGGVSLKPCRSFCHLVEQRCPYFHPRVKEQYAGEPVFKCIDPNIPDHPSITPNSLYGQDGQCYDLEIFDKEGVGVSFDDQNKEVAVTSGAMSLDTCLVFYVTVLCYSVLLYLLPSQTFTSQTVKPP